MLMLIIGLVVGLIVGAIAMYFYLQSTIARQSNELDQSRRQINQLEQEREQRLREATQQLQQDYRQEMSDKTQALEQQVQTYRAEAESANAQLATLRSQVQTYETELNSTRSQLQESRDRIQQLEQLEPQAMQPTSQPMPFTSAAQESQPVAAPVPDSTDSPLTGNMPPASVDLSSPEETVHAPDIESAAPTQSAPPVTSAPKSTPPMRTATPNLDLTDAVNALISKGTASLPELAAYSVQTDPHIRKLAATAIGQAVAGRQQPGTQQAIRTLDRLRQDTDPTVRQAAVEALSRIQSDKVIPLLRKSLRDSDLDVVQAASAAVNQFKFYPKKVQFKAKSPKSANKPKY